MHCCGEEWMGRGEKRDRSLGNEKEEEKLEKRKGRRVRDAERIGNETV